MTPLLMFPPIMDQEEAINPEKHVQQLVDAILRLQFTAYSATYKTKTLKLTPAGSYQDYIPVFEVGDLFLYYQNRISG